MKDILIEKTLANIADDVHAPMICHALCYRGSSSFVWQGHTVSFAAGDSMIVSRRGDMVQELSVPADFKVEVIYVSPEFIDMSAPLSNYGMKGHLSLFDNPVMHLSAEQHAQCATNFATIRHRLAQTHHHFHREVLMSAVQTMMLDFFDFHASLTGYDSVSTSYRNIMDGFLAMLERGDYRQSREVAYYADKLCVTAKYLSEVSKRLSGMPATYWITRFTTLDISRLLRNHKLSLADISDMFGFSSPAHFSRYVLNNLGAKPSDLRD